MNTKSKILLTLGLIGMCLTIISTVSAEDSYVDSAEVLTTDTNPLVEVSNGDSYLKTSEAYLESSELLTADTNSSEDSVGGWKVIPANGTVIDTNSNYYQSQTLVQLAGNELTTDTNPTILSAQGEVISPNGTVLDTNSTWFIVGHQYDPSQENHLRDNVKSMEDLYYEQQVEKDAIDLYGHYYSVDECYDMISKYVDSQYDDYYARYCPIVVETIYDVTAKCFCMEVKYYKSPLSESKNRCTELIKVNRVTGEMIVPHELYPERYNVSTS